MSYTPPIGDATASKKGIVQLSGALGGTASAPTIASAAISSTELTNDSVTEPKLAITNSPSTNQVLTWNGTAMAWTTASAGAVTIADLPAGSTITVAKSGGTWPARPTARTDIIVQWKGADPSPSIVSSGTGGMMDNVDIRFVTP